MYLPKSFEENDRETLHRFMRAHPLATLVTWSEEGACADHLPLLTFDDGEHVTLRGHVARANPVWRQIEANHEVLVVFHDAGSYISPSWYATKAETHRVVPTWNYAAVHARGIARTQHEGDWLHALLTRLTDTFEAGRPTPWKLADAPTDYVETQMKAIVGIEVSVVSVTAKWKMSQNRQRRDVEGVVAGLRSEGDASSAALADEIERRMPR